MSWQAYVDSSLIGSGHLDQAAIISAAGDSVWSHSADFQPKPEEMKHLADILNQAAGAEDKAFAEGLFINGDRYVLTKVDGRSLYARKGRSGICVAKTKQAILVGHHGETQVAGNSTQTVEALADYLIGAGY